MKRLDFQNFNEGSCYNFSIKFREINPNDADIRNLNVNSISPKFDQLKCFIMRDLDARDKLSLFDGNGNIETNVNH